MKLYKISQDGKLYLKPRPVDAKAYQAVSSIMSLGFPNPLNPEERVVDNVKINIAYYDDNTIWLKSIAAVNPRHGDGTRVLKKIIDIANENGVAIYLDPMPFGEIKQQKLIQWYMSNGFVKGKGDFVNGLVHYPVS